MFTEEHMVRVFYNSLDSILSWSYIFAWGVNSKNNAIEAPQLLTMDWKSLFLTLWSQIESCCSTQRDNASRICSVVKFAPRQDSTLGWVARGLKRGMKTVQTRFRSGVSITRRLVTSRTGEHW